MSEMTGLQRLRDFAEKGAAMLTYYQVKDLRVIADQIEAEQEERVTRRVEDRAAAAWVREHGGLEEVWLCHNAADNRRVELCTALGIGTDTGWSDAMAEMVKRLMPEGMEWPRCESGEPVRLGDCVEQWRCVFSVEAVEFTARGGCTLKDAPDGDWSISSHMSAGDAAHLHAPKVYDADGVEIREGDTVYSTRDTESGTVVYAYPPGDGGQPSVKVGAFWHHASELTHRAPVLAADRKPLREKSIVFDKDTGEKLGVDTVDAGNVACRRLEHGGAVVHCDPRTLTHERPDSWERLEEDAGCTATKYNKRRGTIFTTKQQVARDLVRRAEALAGVSGR